MISLSVLPSFNPHTHPTLRVIANYVTGKMEAPLTLSGPEAKQMKEDLANPEFIEAVRELGYTAEITGRKGGVMRITCKRI